MLWLSPIVVDDDDDDDDAAARYLLNPLPDDKF